MSTTGEMFPFALSCTPASHNGMKGAHKPHSQPAAQRAAASHPDKRSPGIVGSGS